MNPTSPLLQVEHLQTAFDTESGRTLAVNDVSLTLASNRTLGIVGESGCGKSVTALSIMRLLPQPAGKIIGGRILFDGTDLVRLPAADMRRLRGRQLAMIFQEPMTALNPVHPIGRQIMEVFHLHAPAMHVADMQAEAVRLLTRVGIAEPQRRMVEYPHQMSGGMRQRVMIAMALAGRPRLLMADEPTTALDVTIQAQILDLIRELQEETGMALLFITHDLGVIADICDTVAVMYAGRIAESAPLQSLFKSPAHPYTQGLLQAIPRLDSTPKTRLPAIEGMVPSLDELPPGCAFHNRCPQVMSHCRDVPPPAVMVGEMHYACCHGVEL